MNKNGVFMIRAKRILAILLCCVVVITLGGCGSSANRNPYGELQKNDVYAQNGSTTLTVKELYDELRYNSLGYFNTQIENAVFASYIETVKKDDAKYKELLDEYILDDIYGTHEEDEIEALTKATIESNINKFIDEMYYKGLTISSEQIKNKDFSTVYSAFYINVAKYLYAEEQLLKEIKETDKEAKDDDEKYFSTSDYVDYYDSNYKNTGDVQGIIIRFLNQDEVNDTLKKFGIKSYKNEWYLIKLPEDGEELENTSDFEEYYDDYTVNPLGNDEKSIKIASGVKPGENSVAILKIFVEIYNYIYTYRNTLDYDKRIDAEGFSDYDGKEFLKYYKLTEAIIEASTKESDKYDGVTYDTLSDLIVKNDEQSKYTNFTKEKLDKFSSSLSSYIYNTLEVKPNTEDDEENTSFIQYNSSANSYGNFYYLMFKLGVEDDEEFYTFTPGEDGEDDKYEIHNDDLKTEIYDLMVEEKLTETYITNEVTSRMAKAEIAIYDSILEINYINSGVADYKETKKVNNDLIGSITIDGKTTKVTVKEAYDFLENLYGPTTATTLLFNKHIKTTKYYTDLNDKYDDYKLSVQNTLTYFANDQYSSYGYPATMGKYNFMKVYYKTTNVDSAIKDFLMVEEAKAAFFADYDDEFYGDLKQYTDLAYDKYFGLTATHLLVYVDMDEDGKPDTDFFNDPSHEADYKVYAQELVTEIVKFVKNSSATAATALEAAVAEYNSSSRIAGVCDNAHSASVECTWAKYKSKGLFVSTATLEEITNTYDSDEDALVNRIKDLYNSTDIIMNGYFTSSYLDNNDGELVLTNDGYNLLLITSGTIASSSEFEDEDKLYNDIPIKVNGSVVKLNGASADEYATEEQIEIYVRDYSATGSCTKLPASVTAALDAYLKPLLTRYSSEVSKNMLMLAEMGEVTSDLIADFDARLDKMIEIAQKNTDNYADISTGNYQNWWTTMYQEHE